MHGASQGGLRPSQGGPASRRRGRGARLRTAFPPPDSQQQASTSDFEKTYLSRWQSSGWLGHVQRCLEASQSAATALAVYNKSVILQGELLPTLLQVLTAIRIQGANPPSFRVAELEGRDLSCVVSSLVQLLLDPFSRTLRGFHTLIQKEWVALGHPFCTRLGHLKPASEDAVGSV